MPTDLFTFQGSWGTQPQTGGLLASGAASLQAQLLEKVTLDAKNTDDYDLAADAPVSVAFGGVVNANVVVIATDRKIRVRLTSADGSQQSIPVDDIAIIISRSVPFTAIDLTRVPATDTHVSVFIGEKA